MACQKHHNSLESLRRSLVKAAAERAVTAEWLEHLKACVKAQGGHLSDIIINENLKLLQINYLSQKVDILFNFPSRSH